MIPTLLGVAILVFLMLRIMGGDPVEVMLRGEGASVSQAVIEMERTRLGIPAYRKTSENANDSELVLHYRDQSYLVNNKHKYAILGREDSCQIIVRNDFASRQHVRIEFRQGKFVIIDQSTNGTYVCSMGGKPRRSGTRKF